ncbi:hypothetical protein [Streptomyces hainanensis]|uniref:Uncharacterized protein n=1 Tax=Streptomyces hainanensis TaxID=402648 RepID=A0A4R4TEJ5_9ACTN|nr:hypothetical protein [Streptomyces hainanensis]TDC75827.1 hypothetical protein E1283_11315 [Streptomyces hainanensis]
MAEHLIRAEYEEDTDRTGADRPVKTWHMVRDGEAQAMCGRVLEPDARVLPDGEWGRQVEYNCHTCGALYLREVPYRDLGPE